MSGIFLFFLSFNLLSFVFLVETAGIEPASGLTTDFGFYVRSFPYLFERLKEKHFKPP